MLRAALLLTVALLQLQSSIESPLTWTDQPARLQISLSASALIEEAKAYVQVR